MKKINLLLVLALLIFSCSKEELDNNTEAAFSSNSSCAGPKPVGTGEFLTTNINMAGQTPDDMFDYVANVYGNVHRAVEDVDSNGKKYFQLGFVVTENSQNPGFVYVKRRPENSAGETQWEKLNPCRKSMVSGFWDTLSKNDAEDVRILQEGTNKNKVYLFFGNNGRKFVQFRVDKGEVLKRGSKKVFTLPGGFNAGNLFFHNFNRADFAANWLGIKGKKLYNFGNKLNNTPSIIKVRNGGFNGADLNSNITKIQGYWPHNTKRIVLEKQGGSTITIEKERKSGVNFYKS